MALSAAALAAAQAAYYLPTGLWPMVHARSFQLVTGPKRELWLVRTVGALIVAIGAALAVSAATAVSPGDRVLAVLSATMLALVDAVYVARNVIGPVYLADAAIEAALIGAWLAA